MTVAEVKLWGRTIGAAAWDEVAQVANFEYAPEFVGSGIEVAPISMPLSHQIYAFPELPRASFKGLPGLLADSLPDDFGNALIDAWLATQGRTAASFNPVERLCYTGTRGMGALEFQPAAGPGNAAAEQLDLAELTRLAGQILTQRKQLSASFDASGKEHSLKQILQVGTSAGGARAKAVIAWNPETSEVRSGQVAAGSGFSYWILKFDGVSGNKDKELEDPTGYGQIEYAYYLMAKACAVEMSECRLLEENGRQHFMTRRFDRSATGQKIHMLSLAALAHFDYRSPGAYSYEQAFLIIQRLGLGKARLEQQFRRMAFNVIARNQDDHVKNIAFLMNQRGEWDLSPAFDVTYSYNPQGMWTGRHQMSLNRKRDDFSLEDFKAAAEFCALKKGRAEEICAEVQAVVAQWPDFAGKAGVPEQTAQQIQHSHRMNLSG